MTSKEQPVTDPYIGRVKVGRITRDFREQPMTEKNDVLKECLTCGSIDPGGNEFCSDGFHAPGETYWPCEHCGGTGNANTRPTASELTQGITDRPIRPDRGGGCVEPPHSDVVERLRKRASELPKEIADRENEAEGQCGDYGTSTAKDHQDDPDRLLMLEAAAGVQELVERLEEARNFIYDRSRSDTSWGDAAESCDILARLDATLAKVRDQ